MGGRVVVIVNRPGSVLPGRLLVADPTRGGSPWAPPGDAVAMSVDQPSPDELRRYVCGALPLAAARTVEAWLAQQPETSVEALLATVADAAGQSLPVDLLPPDAGFATDRAASRHRVIGNLGEGGMAQVALAEDLILGRQVALKQLKARRVDESLEVFLLREQAFRREAALTASLEHPSIPPVYDVGSAGGRAAFTLRRVAGTTVAERMRTESLPALGLVPALLRAVEAIAYAHARGVVHRDLSPANILLGSFGEVQVLDWGLAVRVGEGAGLSVGTPGWTAPEQQHGAPGDPRLDVYAIGALVHLLLAGGMPGDSPSPRRPRGLVAIMHRCLAAPAGRYADAGEVAAELRRWLDDGLTLAEEAGPLARGWWRVRRSRRLRAAVLTLVGMTGVACGAAWWQHHAGVTEARQRLERIAAVVDASHAESLRLALSEVEPIRTAHPALVEAATLVARLQSAAEVLAQQAHAAAGRAGLEALLERTRRSGSWPGEVEAWQAALAVVDPPLPAPAGSMDWSHLPDAPAIGEALTWLWRAAAERGDHVRAQAAAQRLALGGPDVAWRALGRLCNASRFAAHEPVAPAGADRDLVLANPATAAVALAIFAADVEFSERALRVLRDQPGAFWPLLAAGRAALAAGQAEAARAYALTAQGAEPESMFPPLLLAYVALAQGDDATLARAVGLGLRFNPAHGELLGLQAVALVRAGHHDDALAVVERLGGDHLRYHLAHRVGHPMEATVDALVAAGLTIPAGTPALGPLVPGHHH